MYKSRSNFVSFPRMVFIALFPRLRHEDALKSETKLRFRRKIRNGGVDLW